MMLTMGLRCDDLYHVDSNRIQGAKSMLEFAGLGGGIHLYIASVVVRCYSDRWNIGEILSCGCIVVAQKHAPDSIMVDIGQ